MLQNRVNPWGELVAVREYGTLMGNRGILHNADQRIVRQWQHKAWVTCLLEFGGLRRPKPFSTTDNYSELFFLDEATSFAAGHRPCHYCQRGRAKLFKQAWCAAHNDGTTFVSQGDMDSQLHRERASRKGQKVTYQERAGVLPFGTMFTTGHQSYLVTPRGFLTWSFAGYGAGQQIDVETVVAVLTPKSTVAAFNQGFTPKVHPSANIA